MKILITGGAGFIGSHFIRHLLAREPDAHVVNIDKLTYAGNLANLSDVEGNPRYSFRKGDVCDPATVAEAISGCSTVVHFAAESHVDRSIYHPAPALHANVTGTLTLLEAARCESVSKFLHVSTDEVYGDVPQNEFATEEWPLRPSSPYAASKAGADLLVRSFVRTYGVPAIIARPTNNYGPNQFPEKFLPLMIANALEGKPLPLYGAGDQQRSWLHVTDTCAALEAVLERGIIGEIYNIGGSSVESNIEMARRILRDLDLPDTLLQHVEDRPGHDARYALSSNKIRKEMGWTDAVTLDEGLANTIEWYRNNSAWMDGVRRGEYRAYYEKYYANRSASLQAIRRGPRQTKND